MNKSISVLVIDDSDDQIDYIICRLREAGYEPFAERVHNANAFKSALLRRKWQIIIANPHMRSFSTSKALRLLQGSGRPVPPLVLISKTGRQKGADKQDPWPGFLHFLAASDPEGSGAEHPDPTGKAGPPDSQALSPSLWEHIPFAFYFAEQGNPRRIIYISPQIKERLEISTESFVRDPDGWSKRIHPDDRDRVMAEWANAEKNSGAFYTHYRLLSGGGDVVRFLDVSSIISGSENEACRRAGLMLEITGDTGDLYAGTDVMSGYCIKTVIDSLPIPLMIYGTDNKVSLSNEATIASLGFDPMGMDQLSILKRVSSRLITEEKTHFEDTLSDRALKGETITGKQYSFRTFSGDKRIVLCSAFPIRFQDEIINAVVLWEDITDRERLNKALKQARDDLERKVSLRTFELTKTIDLLKQEIRMRQDVEKQLQSSNELMKKIFSNEHILIAYMDDRFNFIKVNEAYARADDKTPDFYPGKNHFHLFPNEENEGIFREVVRTGKPYTVYAKPFQYPMNPERGTSYWDWSLQPVKNESGRVEEIILFLVDVTKRVEAEKNMTMMQTELIRSEHLSQIGALASTVAHELRNPLAVIETACFNISHKNRNPALERNLANIEECLEESNQIINNLLFYARRGLPSYEMFTICDLLGECIEQAKKRYRTKKVRIEKRCNLPKDIRMEADPLQMKELFGNILNNAMDAIGKEGGKILLSTRLENKATIRIDFKDNGQGIRKEDLEKVQNPFFSTKSRGTGLGLAVCRQIIDLHNGRIKIKSAEGKGTTVTLTLPLRKGM